MLKIGIDLFYQSDVPALGWDAPIPSYVLQLDPVENFACYQKEIQKMIFGLFAFL